MNKLDVLAEKSAIEFGSPFTKNNLGTFDFAYKRGFKDALRMIPITEKMPKIQDFYIVTCKYSFPKNCKNVIAEFDIERNVFVSEDDERVIEDVTHWRPLNLEHYLL